jgi:hypothetical protein
MKLLAELQKKVGGMETLCRAWFTSFCLEIEFFETYVLPATLGTDRPRSRLDFEQLQQEITDKDIDVRIFCDPRFVDSHRIKRTCVPVHGIRPQRSSRRFSEPSLFHPKLIYLEDREGKRILGAGSANLTLSGWGRNLEAFSFREVTTRDNYREIRRFFEELCRCAGLPSPLNAQGRFGTEKPDWRFVHSFQEKSFASQILGGAQDTDLVIWSPYLPRDLAGFIARVETAAGVEGLRVHLVPDRLQGRYLRTEWSEQLSRMTADGRLTFYDSPVKEDPRSELRHAKLWKVPGKLAIGSWNFTGPGSNCLLGKTGAGGGDSNVEAGIIFDDRHLWRNACGTKLDLGPDDCASFEQLESESLPDRPLPPFDLHIGFDWHALEYRFDGEWLGNGPRDAYSLGLPGVESRVALKWTGKGQPAQPGRLSVDDRELLRDRVFKVYRNDREIYRGLVSERNPRSRRAQCFDSLHDLLEAIVHEDDGGVLIDLPFRVPLEDDSLPDEPPSPADADGVLRGEGEERAAVSYFRLFRSTLAYEEKLLRSATLEQLEREVFVLPGCLLELTAKSREALQQPGSAVFKWFLANEVSALSRIARRRRRELAARRGAKYDPVPGGRWKELEIVPPEPPGGVGQDYCELVRKQSRYG